MVLYSYFDRFLRVIVILQIKPHLLQETQKHEDDRKTVKWCFYLLRICLTFITLNFTRLLLVSLSTR